MKNQVTKPALRDPSGFSTADAEAIHCRQRDADVAGHHPHNDSLASNDSFANTRSLGIGPRLLAGGLGIAAFMAVMAGSIDAQAPAGAPPIKIEVIPTPAGVPDKKAMSGGDQGGNQSGAPASPAKANNAAEVPENSLGPEDYRKWPTPDLTLVLSGNQHGYIEPCGCTGLANQKGGVARRYSFLEQLKQNGWTLAPVDAGNQVRRFGIQAEIKLQRTAEALRSMNYQSVGFGPEDVRLGVGELLSVANPPSDAVDDILYVSANVVLLDEPSFMAQHKVFERGGMKVGVTTILDPASLESELSSDITVNPPVPALKAALASINEKSPDFRVLTFFGEEAAAEQLVRDVQGFDIVVVSGGYGEPTYQAQTIEGTKTRMLVTGNKGMYVGLVGLYRNAPMKYCRVPLTDEFDDAKEMRKLMAEYQNQLRDLGLEGLGLKPIPHSTRRTFVGSKKCGECHTTAYEIWENTPHAEATESLVHPGERSDVARHFDPECLSCHVTGWNPQNYYPYVSGYLSLEGTSHLTGNGCENCHGPGAEHVAAEAEGASVNTQERDLLRDAMKLPLAKAKEKCMECHDLDNSPDFHIDDAFEDEYWPQVEHEGKD
ncbi:multiheme c-type cytochrome [Novipirellula sp.]|uniref:multiheme c-type cytochrome n=1 Tax=Novipirellula sp. TaxID=2795430 RepID=UPI003563ECF7